jgi:LysM repeat protein
MVLVFVGTAGIIDPMTERTAHDAGVIACPFVAFVDDRDERADVPDHRHRCYAEIRPAQRAIAHQQVFCLSAGFSTCPTFQDWAKRESARARAASAAPRPNENEPAEARSAEPVRSEDGPPPPDDVDEGSLEDDPFDDRATRNPHRDWAAPPPWVDPAGPDPDHPADAPPFLSERSSGGDPDLAAGAAGLSSSRWLQDVPPPRPDDAVGPPARDPDDELERALAEDRANRERSAAVGTTAAVGATASGSRTARRTAAYAAPTRKVSQARRKPVEHDVAGPSWERPRRNEAYPTLKTRIGLPSVPRIALAFLALIAAAVVVFSVPFLLHGGDSNGGTIATPLPLASASGASTEPTVAPAATAKIYVVKTGDTLLKIAKKFGITVDQLIAANKQIKNPNKIGVGDELKIPVPTNSGVIDESSAAPGSSTSAAP